MNLCHGVNSDDKMVSIDVTNTESTSARVSSSHYSYFIVYKLNWNIFINEPVELYEAILFIFWVVYILKVKLWSSRNVLWKTELHLTSHQHAREEMMTESSFLREKEQLAQTTVAAVLPLNRQTTCHALKLKLHPAKVHPVGELTDCPSMSRL